MILSDYSNDEHDFMGSLGRTRRCVPGEWDDYIFLYSDTEALVLSILDADTQPDPTFDCPVCEFKSLDFRGLTVHLSRRHNIRSDRADYFASRKEA